MTNTKATALLTSMFALSVPLWCSTAQAAEGDVIDVGLGESVIQRDSRAVARVLISDPEIAELRLLEEGQYQVRGIAVGSTDLWVWYRDDIAHPRTYKVVVNADLTDIQRRVASTVGQGATPPQIYPIKDHIVVEGDVADLETLERISQIAKVYDEDFINLLTVRGDHQVQLKVVFAEVNRSGLRELGLNVFTAPPGFLGSMTGPNNTASSTLRYLPESANSIPNMSSGIMGAPAAGAFNLSGYLYGFLDIGAILSVLEQNDVARTLAQPTLVALSGQQAEFLAGGEIPIPVAQQNNAITVEYKEYGVKVVFVPTVLSGNIIDLRTYVEVSEIDQSNSTQVSGITIPALSSRKGESHLRLENGMTFAMAGMLSETNSATRAHIPIIGEIPIVGALFRYVRHERAETELVIFVTPQLVRPMAPGEVPPPPGTTENYNPSDLELFLLGSLTHVGSRTAEPTGEYGMQR
jgi:pilus assembly protein CpaC